MSRQVVCPSCDEAENLAGAPSEDGIVITCGTCGASWLRDSVPGRCATCGSSDIETRPQAMTQYSRGTQVSIVGFRHAPLCAHCDADMLERSREGKPIPTQYISAAAKARAEGDDSPPDTKILPG